MLNALAEFFSPEAGQARRRWLNEQEQRFGNALAGYLGPAAQPIQNAALLAGYLTPGADMMDASQASREMFAAETPLDAAAAGAAMLGATGMVLLPGNYNALSEGFSRTVDDMAAAYDPSRVNALIAYHGSPHTFDRFSLDKIGTGEGAQAYGHGLYFAEDERVARSYRQALAPGEDPRQGVIFRGTEMPDAPPQDALGQLAQYMRQSGYTPEDAFARAQRTFSPEMLRSIEGISPQDFSVYVPDKYTGTGSMYQVQINADPSQLLDWDAPLSAQPGPVREALAGFGIVHDDAAARAYDDALLAQLFDNSTAPLPRQPSDPTGGAIYEHSRLVSGDYRNPPMASQRLREAGIPGIQYLDAGSRSAGEGSRNFVIFDDSIINILKRYGIGAAAVGGGWALAPGEAEAATNAGILDPQNRDRETIQSWLATQ